MICWAMPGGAGLCGEPFLLYRCETIPVPRPADGPAGVYPAARRVGLAYSLFVVEDPLEEEDFEGHAEMTGGLGGTLIIGDDLFVTNRARLQRGVALGAANAMLLKPNMVGTITEAMDAARYAATHKYRVVALAGPAAAAEIRSRTLPWLLGLRWQSSAPRRLAGASGSRIVCSGWRRSSAQRATLQGRTSFPRHEVTRAIENASRWRELGTSRSGGDGSLGACRAGGGR